LQLIDLQLQGLGVGALQLQLFRGEFSRLY
jgi:hypothetical protein